MSVISWIMIYVVSVLIILFRMIFVYPDDNYGAVKLTKEQIVTKGEILISFIPVVNSFIAALILSNSLTKIIWFLFCQLNGEMIGKIAHRIWKNIVLGKVKD